MSVAVVLPYAQPTDLERMMARIRAIESQICSAEAAWDARAYEDDAQKEQLRIAIDRLRSEHYAALMGLHEFIARRDHEC